MRNVLLAGVLKIFKKVWKNMEPNGPFDESNYM